MLTLYNFNNDMINRIYKMMISVFIKIKLSNYIEPIYIIEAKNENELDEEIYGVYNFANGDLNNYQLAIGIVDPSFDYKEKVILLGSSPYIPKIYQQFYFTDYSYKQQIVHELTHAYDLKNKGEKYFEEKKYENDYLNEFEINALLNELNYALKFFTIKNKRDLFEYAPAICLTMVYIFEDYPQYYDEYINNVINGAKELNIKLDKNLIKELKQGFDCIL